MTSALKRLVLLAVLAIAGFGWNPAGLKAAVSASPDPSHRVLAEISHGSVASIDLSADRRVLYVADAKDGHFGSGQEAAQAELTIYDVADPAAPQLLSTLALGDLSMWRVVARGQQLIILHGWGDPKRPFGVMVIDVHDAAHPMIAGNVAANGDLELSRDGTIGRVTSFWPKHSVTAFKLDRPDQPLPADQVHGEFDPVSRDRDPFPGPFGYLREEINGRMLFGGWMVLHLMTRVPDAAPQRILSVPFKAAIADARFLADGTSAVVVAQDGVRIVSLAPAALGATRLEAIHARRLADYPGELKKRLAPYPAEVGPYLTPLPRKLDGFYLELAIALEEAGVRNLMDDAKAASLPLATRIEVLNDYGFWLSKSTDPIGAVDVLKKVVALAPDRAIAALNLGDAARAAITAAPTWQQKTSLAKIGLQAYDAYRRLTGKDAPAAQQFAALHARDFDDVCSYVATFYNAGRRDELLGIPDPVDLVGDGKLRHVYAFTQGTANVPVIIATTKSKSETEARSMLDEDSEVNFGDPGLDSLAEPHVFPFKGSYYVVYEQDDGPSAVDKPNGPVMCRFKRNFTAVLTEDHAPAICKKAEAGFAFGQVPRRQWSDHAPSITSELLLRSHLDTSSVDLTGYSEIKFDPAGSLTRIGYFEVASGAGRGCDVNGVVLLNGNALEQSARSTALLNAQGQMTNCAGSKASLVRANGEVLIEVDGGQLVQQTVPPRLLLRVRSDKIETACRVDQQPSYVVRPTTERH